MDYISNKPIENHAADKQGRTAERNLGEPHDLHACHREEAAPEDFKDQNEYRQYLDEIKPLLMELWHDGIIVSSKVQCCTFNLKQWQKVES